MPALLRRIHRICSVLFTLGFIANVVAILLVEVPPTWVYVTALVPLFVLFPTGLYMFLRPWLSRAA
ncbi:hypothetical protein [Pseudoroseicyclus sp. CXY001]|uniref:hypothetical protein n=1 Tax=Pseudoroseicyclus sp. CXY001 TaxID=3242492 RepID=UPI00358DB30E